MLDASVLSLGSAKKDKSMDEKLLGFFHIIANKVRASAKGATVL